MVKEVNLILIKAIIFIHEVFSTKDSQHIIQVTSFPFSRPLTLKQNPSLKFPKSSRPPENPFLVSITGLMLASANDLIVLVRSFLRDDKENIPSFPIRKKKDVSLGISTGPKSSEAS